MSAAWAGDALVVPARRVTVVESVQFRRYAVRRPLEVSAVRWDGSRRQARSIVRRVVEAGFSAWLGEGGVLVEQWPAPVWLESGTVLVLDRYAAVAWSAYPEERFAATYRELPRELPIFGDGEVA